MAARRGAISAVIGRLRTDEDLGGVEDEQGHVNYWTVVLILNPSSL